MFKWLKDFYQWLKADDVNDPVFTSILAHKMQRKEEESIINQPLICPEFEKWAFGDCKSEILLDKMHAWNKLHGDTKPFLPTDDAFFSLHQMHKLYTEQKNK
jgi:hypothetical protein